MFPGLIPGLDHQLPQHLRNKIEKAVDHLEGEGATKW